MVEPGYHDNSQPANTHQKPVQGLIFDLGGVILRTEEPASRIELARRLGKTRDELEEIVFNNPVAKKAEEGQATRPEVWKAIMDLLELKQEEISQVRQAFFAGDRVDFGMIQWIQKLHPNLRTGLLSNTWARDLPAYLQNELKISPGTFDVVISSAFYQVAKPKPEIYRIALDHLGLRPEQVVFVDDNLRNIEGARAVGLHGILFRSFDQLIPEISPFLPFSNKNS